jgi:glycosyltransferase involved in cell wall biosynthesis
MSEESPIEQPEVARVAWNGWRHLRSSEVHDSLPELVSVIVPYYEDQEALDRTLAALDHQTYPTDRFEVSVVDDGSSANPVLGDHPYSSRVLGQVRDGSGLARAQDLGARSAEGTILVFLDSDMMPEPTFVAAHAKWHSAYSNLVTIGPRNHVDIDHVSIEDVATAAQSGSLGSLFDPLSVETPRWIAEHLERSEHLTAGEYQWRVMSGGNLGLRADTYAEAGGINTTFNRWGGEDNEFAYRLLQLGYVAVPEPAALCWHQGALVDLDADERTLLKKQKPKLLHSIADRSYRRDDRGALYEVPSCIVQFDMDGRVTSTELVDQSIVRLLGTRGFDGIVQLPSLGEEPDQFLDERYEHEGRVVRELPDAAAFSPIHLALPVGLTWKPDSLRRIERAVGPPDTGQLVLDKPVGAVVVTSTRARNGARRAGPFESSMEELYGIRHESGSVFGIGAVGNGQMASAKAGGSGALFRRLRRG